ncbi:MAG TPA: hypothetical protein VFS78_17255 [Vicinamibacteria bacterium]|nr:hypothetical protein [Vicinamibacteria bacterium]
MNSGQGAGRKPYTIIEALRDPRLLGGLPAFSNLESWTPWLTFLSALYGLPLSEEEQQRFCKHTGRTRYAPPEGGFREAAVITGVQSGKSRIASTIAAYEGLVAQPQADSTHLYAAVLAQDERGARRTIFSYAAAPFECSAALARRVVNRTTHTIQLDTGVVIAAYPCRPASIRGIRARVLVLDEFAYYIGSDSAGTDKEMLRAARGRIATTGGRVVIISSPYGQAGALWDLHRAHFGRDDSSVLVWQASAPEMNPTLAPDYLERMRADDPDAYRSEVLGEFRAGVSSLFDAEALEAVVVRGRREAVAVSGVNYSAFVDPSGGRADAFALAIGHQSGERAVVDLVRAWPPPFNPSGVVAEAAEILKSYRVHCVFGDRYGGEWPRESFRAHGIRYEPAEEDRSALYLQLLPRVNADAVELPDIPALLRELRSLERRRGSSGRDRVDHRRGCHDDQANAVAGVVALLKPTVEFASVMVSGVNFRPTTFVRPFEGPLFPRPDGRGSRFR